MSESASPHFEREHAERQGALDDVIAQHEGKFDAMMVVGTWTTENGETAMVVSASGNWYAQNGMLAEIMARRAIDTQHARIQTLRREDGDE